MVSNISGENADRPPGTKVLRTLKGQPIMRKDLYTTISWLIALSFLTAGSTAMAARDPLSAAPTVAPADREKLPARPPKLLPVTEDDIRAELKRLQTDILLKENDAQAHIKLAEAYGKYGRHQDAANEYQKALELDPTSWVGYHQLMLMSNDPKQIDAMIEKLSKYEKEKPKELMCRVALSEMYEKRGNFYQAARTLVDCTYAGGVPEKWRVRVNARIHNMLLLAKSQKTQVEDATTTAAANVSGTEEDLDIMPAPLPTPSSKRSIAQAKLKDAKEVRGMGNTPLLP